jgi:hypothetical protein
MRVVHQGLRFRVRKQLGQWSFVEGVDAQDLARFCDCVDNSCYQQRDSHVPCRAWETVEGGIRPPEERKGATEDCMEGEGCHMNEHGEHNHRVVACLNEASDASFDVLLGANNLHPR